MVHETLSDRSDGAPSARDVVGRVSIVVPSYNYAGYLPACIASIRAQSYPDWEALIVDDGSTDDTAAVAATLVVDPSNRISYHRLENGGVARARNFGIEQSSGEFILPLDADDMLAPDALNEFVGALRADAQAGFAFCALQNFGALPGESRDWKPGLFSPARIRYENPAACTSMWRRSLWHAGVRYRELIYEDWDLWLQITARGFRGRYVPAELFHYRMHRHGRHTLNKHRYSQALFQVALANPTLYGTDLRSWAEVALANGPRAFELPTIVFLPSANNPEFQNFNGPLARLAAEFVRRGHFVATFGAFQSLPPLRSFMPIRCTAELDPNFVLSKLYSIGRQLILITDLPSEMLRRIRAAENLHTVVAFDDRAAEPADAAARPTAPALGDLVDVSLHTGPSGIEIVSAERWTTVSSIPDLTDLILRAHDRAALKRGADQQELRFAQVELFERAKFADPAQSLDVGIAISCEPHQLIALAAQLKNLRATPATSALPLFLFHNLPEGAPLQQIEKLGGDYRAAVARMQGCNPYSRAQLLQLAPQIISQPWLLFLRADTIVASDLLAVLAEYVARFGAEYLFAAERVRLLPGVALPSLADETICAELLRDSRFAVERSSVLQLVSRPWIETHGFYDIGLVGSGGEDQLLIRAAELSRRKPIWIQNGHVFQQWSLDRRPCSWRDADAQVIADFERQLVRAGLTIGQPRGMEFPPAYADCDRIEALVLAGTAHDRKHILQQWGLHLLAHREFHSAWECFDDLLAMGDRSLATFIGLSRCALLAGKLGPAAHYALLAERIAADDPVVQQLTKCLQDISMEKQ